MKLFILAAGQNTRWKISKEAPPYPKQLLPIASLPLICRTVIQVIDYEPVIVTCHPAIVEAVRKYDVEIFDPTPRNRWACESVLSTSALWDDDRTIILLGDVLYSQQAIRRILAMPQLAAGHRHELFALQWPGWMNQWAVYCAEQECSMTASGMVDGGKLFALYRLMSAMPDPNAQVFDDRYLWIEDYFTQDFDTVKQWRDFVSKCNRGKVKEPVD